MSANFSNIGFDYANQSAIDDNNASGYLVTGDQLAFQVQTDEPVTVSGSPQLQLNNGELAFFDPSKTNPMSVNFIYTVQPGDISDGLQVTGLIPNGGAITGSDGGPLAGNVTGDVGVLVDAQPPSLSFNPGVTFSSPGTVTFSGTASDNVGVTNVEIFGSINGGGKTDIGSANLDGSGSWSFTADFGGPETITGISAETSDPAGNITDASGLGELRTGGEHNYVYTSGSGPDLIDHFKLKGVHHDVLTVPEFKSIAGLVAAITGAHNTADGLLIPLGGDDSVTLGGVTKAQAKTEALAELAHHKATDFKFG